MLLYRFNRGATAIRLIGLALIVWSLLGSISHPTSSGRGVLIALLSAAAVIAWLSWTAKPHREHGVTLDLYVLAVAGGLLVGAAPKSAASAFAFVGIASAGFRVELPRALPILALGVLAVCVSVLIYDGSGLGALAYSLGYAAAMLAASNARQSVVRAEQAELLLAQTQRSQEEQLRVARLEESTRIARDIHDVLAHALAGLTLQLEATASLLEHGADSDVVLARVRRAHELAREGLQETRRAVGALRGDDTVSVPTGVEALVAEYRATAEATAELTIDGDQSRLTGQTGQAVLRAVQEALTNVRKHAPGAGVSVAVHAGADAGDDVVVLVDDHPTGAQPAAALAGAGGGYGLLGMRERAQLLGGTFQAGQADGGWRVELRLPPPTGPEVEP
ncbi:MAG: sensor histidine kinase [Solirubrobacteraceae bacterium]